PATARGPRKTWGSSSSGSTSASPPSPSPRRPRPARYLVDLRRVVVSDALITTTRRRSTHLVHLGGIAYRSAGGRRGRTSGRAGGRVPGGDQVLEGAAVVGGDAVDAVEFVEVGQRRDPDVRETGGGDPVLPGGDGLGLGEHQGAAG